MTISMALEWSRESLCTSEGVHAAARGSFVFLGGDENGLRNLPPPQIRHQEEIRTGCLQRWRRRFGSVSVEIDWLLMFDAVILLEEQLTCDWYPVSPLQPRWIRTQHPREQGGVGVNQGGGGEGRIHRPNQDWNGRRCLRILQGGTQIRSWL